MPSGHFAFGISADQAALITQGYIWGAAGFFGWVCGEMGPVAPLCFMLVGASAGVISADCDDR